jgi:fatty-acyl-CoA synthase
MEIALSPLDFARRTRRLHPDREAVVDGPKRFSYRQFFERCDRFSSALLALGVVQGDRVAYLAPNTHQHLEGYYAVPQIGAVIVPMNYRLTADDFVYLINHSGARVVCVDREYLDAIDSVRDQLPGVIAFVALEQAGEGWLDYEQLLAQASTEFERPVIEETDLLSINYTSGTTSRPKGVMISHRNAALNMVGTMLHMTLGVSDRYLWTLPMFHANGWTHVWIMTAVAGTHVCLRKVDPPGIFERIDSEQISYFCAAPTVLIGIANAPESLRGNARRGVRVMTAGAPPAAATIERIEGELGWTVTQIYGLTETSPLICICEPLPEHEALSISERAVVKARQGVEPLLTCELRVVDDDGVEVAHDGNSMGEIVVRGNVVMRGYYNDPEATAKAIRDGWFHTGDAAVVHADGYLEIRDRIKDVIISGGENISSVEVEGVLLRHPAVLEVAIVGLPHERWGEAPQAFVVLRSGSSATADEIRQFARQNLAHFKVPQGVTFIAELPKTATGKIQKYLLRGGAAISRQ